MRKLIVAATLVTALAFPLLSRAEVNAFGVSVPFERTRVSDNIRGGSFTVYPFYPIRTQKLNNGSGTANPVRTEYHNVYTVFGVNLSGSDVI
jgi:hypothetical protein